MTKRQEDLPPYHVEPASDALPEDFYTELSVGEILRRARIAHNLNHAQVEQALRIKISYLEAMENDSLDALPGRVYTFGFVRTYAEFLGLDGEKMAELLRRKSGAKVAPRPVLAVTMEEEDSRMPSWQIVGGSTLLLFIVLAVIAALSPDGGDESVKAVPSVPADLTAQLSAPSRPEAPPQTAAETSDGKEGGNSSSAVPALEPTPHHPVILRALQNVWLEIRDGAGKPVFSRVLTQGEEYWVPAEQTGYVMTLGNAGGLQFIVEGKELPLLGREGQVRRGIKLEPGVIRSLAGEKNSKSVEKSR